MSIKNVLKVVVGLTACAGAVILTKEALDPIVDKQKGIKYFVGCVGESAIASMVGILVLSYVCDGIEGYATLGKALSQVKL